MIRRFNCSSLRRTQIYRKYISVSTNYAITNLFCKFVHLLDYVFDLVIKRTEREKRHEWRRPRTEGSGHTNFLALPLLRPFVPSLLPRDRKLDIKISMNGRSSERIEPSHAKQFIRLIDYDSSSIGLILLLVVLFTYLQMIDSEEEGKRERLEGKSRAGREAREVLENKREEKNGDETLS